MGTTLIGRIHANSTRQTKITPIKSHRPHLDNVTGAAVGCGTIQARKERRTDSSKNLIVVSPKT